MVGEPQNLIDIMNVVATGLDSGEISPENAKRTRQTSSARPAGPALTEFDAFAHLDPLLAGLQKQYLDAKAQRLQAVKEFGADSPMTEMAVDAEDSAWCAAQTRYIELRADRALMGEAQTMIREAEEEERAAEKEALEKEAMTLLAHMQMVERMHTHEKTSSNFGWWLLFYLLSEQAHRHVQQMLSYQQTYRFNRVAA